MQALAARRQRDILSRASKGPSALFSRRSGVLVLVDKPRLPEDIAVVLKIPSDRMVQHLKDRTVRRHRVRDPYIGCVKLDMFATARILELEGIVRWDK